MRHDADRVARDRQPSIDADQAERLADLCRLLADENRVRLLHALVVADELCVSDLATVVGASATSMSQALRLLRTAGIVRNHRAGRTVIYSLDDDRVRRLLYLTLQYLRHETELDEPSHAHTVRRERRRPSQ